MELVQNVKAFIIVLLFVIPPVISTNDFDNTTILIRKCCDVNYTMKGEICMFENYTDLLLPMYENVTKISVNISFVFNSTECKNDSDEDYVKLLPYISPDNLFFAQNNGTLWIPTNNSFIDNDQYCIDYFEEVGVPASVCVCEFDDSCRIESSTPATVIGAAISLPFLLVTFIVYALLPEQNLHGMCLMSYVFALFWSFFLSLLFYYLPSTLHSYDIVCQITGKLMYYFFTSFFFWMNAMSFDICLTFSGQKGFPARNKISDRKRFLMYRIYAWGAPLLMVIFYIFLSYVFTSDEWYNPGEGCWIIVDVSQFLLFYGPIAILLALNIIFFVITTWKIKEARKGILYLLKSKDNKKHLKNEDKQKFYLYVKLLFGMGINWSISVVIWLIYSLGGNVPYVLAEIADFCDGIYGVFIFFIFVFKKSIWNSLKIRYYMMRAKYKTVHEPDTTRTDIYLSELTT